MWSFIQVCCIHWNQMSLIILAHLSQLAFSKNKHFVLHDTHLSFRQLFELVSFLNNCNFCTYLLLFIFLAFVALHCNRLLTELDLFHGHKKTIVLSHLDVLSFCVWEYACAISGICKSEGNLRYESLPFTLVLR